MITDVVLLGRIIRRKLCSRAKLLQMSGPVNAARRTAVNSAANAENQSRKQIPGGVSAGQRIQANSAVSAESQDRQESGGANAEQRTVVNSAANAESQDHSSIWRYLRRSLCQLSVINVRTVMGN